MNNRVLLAALAGGVAAFLGGWVIYGMLLDPNYFQGQLTEAGAAVVRPPEEMKLWAIAVSNLIYGLLLALIFDRWASISTLKTGAIAGAVICGLFALSQGFMWHAYANMMKDMSSILVDTIASVVLGALIGGVVGWVLGYKRA